MDTSNPDLLVKTRFLVISDTHGARCLPGNNRLIDPVDVAIHCGDLTEESKLAEFRATLELMKTIQASLKLVIAGNHDWTLDTPMFKKKIAEIAPPVDMELVRREYGDFGEAQRILQASAKNEDDDESGIVFMDEGTRTFTLSNGASLTLFASPCTPSADDWGFQYDARGGHQWDIGSDVDVVVTHGPPEGVMDRTATGSRIGCPGLFAAVARAKPRLHCFGHVHRGWGAKLARWRGGEAVGGPASHFGAFDNDRSVVVETLAGLTPRDFDGPDAVAEKRRRLEARTAAGCFATSHCAGDEHPLRKGEGTLFVNAAVQGDGEQPQHLPWVVDIELPRAARDAAA
ncbi:Metallophosphoesterase domain-containing protein 1 [Colletotrichum higginsianum]|uniref:Metallophosphoesterase domain-containing protein 1 n=2 Tax=Colletotrichum higginsianum TaxID=80884 RepID=A0A4T0VLC1_9PEZI|nr:Metallophosphoesterase domain-containing protein 1 [Colletotrichum higginsianum]